jgi:chromate transporter
MSESLHLTLGTADWLALFMHFATLSLLAIGGAITTAPDMHRFLVDRQHWLTDPQFSSSIAIAQAAPGPNVLFVALMGWNVGLNAGGYATAALGLTATLVGVLLPSSTLTYFSAQWGHRNRHRRSVRAFKAGMAPIVVALLIGTGWVLAGTQSPAAENWQRWLLTAATALVVWRTKLHLLWLLGAGALLGAIGWV